MITYPCYDDNPVYEDDQYTVNKILYDPRIKPVSIYIITRIDYFRSLKISQLPAIYVHAQFPIQLATVVSRHKVSSYMKCKAMIANSQVKY